MTGFGRLSALSLLCFPLVVSATALEQAAEIESETIESAAMSQARINTSDEAIHSMQAEIERLERDIDNLTTYRDHLDRLIQSQEEEKTAIVAQIEEVAQTRKGVVPFMYRLLDQLDVWLTKDLPFNAEARHQRVEQLKAMMSRADVSDAEKLRRLLEAYQIELDYGSKLGLYRQTLTLDGTEKVVDVLHLGRVSLVAKSLKGDRFWLFDGVQSRWVELDKASADDLQHAFDVASDTSPPALLNLPLSVTVGNEEG